MNRLVFASIVTFVGCGIAAAGAAAGDAAESRSARIGLLRFQFPDRFRQLGDAHGALVADYPLSRNSPTVRYGVFPRSGVLFELSREPKLPYVIPAPTVRFPLSLSDLGRSHPRPNGQNWQLRFRVKNAVYWAIVWLGKSASAQDRAAIVSVVASIRTVT
jgi:hypothetical protein